VNLSDFWVIIFLSRQSPRAKEVVTPIYESSYRRINDARVGSGHLSMTDELSIRNGTDY
jgi:hypothetical protein